MNGGIGGGLLGGLASGLFVGLFFWLVTILVSGLGLGLVLGLSLMLISGFIARQLTERFSLFPNEGIWHSGRNGLVSGMGVGLSIGLGVGHFGGTGNGLDFGLLFGLLVALGGGLNAFVQHYTLRFWLWRLGYLPWNLVPFLDETAKRLLLRKVGGSYIFVHRQLLDYFASLEHTDV